MEIFEWRGFELDRYNQMYIITYQIQKKELIKPKGKIENRKLKRKVFS